MYCIVAIEDNKMGFSSYCMSLSLYIMFAICLSFSSPPLHPCRFIRPLSLYPPSLFASFAHLLLFARVLVCLLVIMASLISSPLSPENEVLNFIQRERENLKMLGIEFAMLKIDLLGSNLLLFSFAIFM